MGGLVTPARSRWRSYTLMAAVWGLVLGVLYEGMERWLAPPRAQVLSTGTLQLQRHQDGHFYVDGPSMVRRYAFW